MDDRSRYIWDRSGRQDPELARLEARLRRFAYDAPLDRRRIQAARRGDTLRRGTRRLVQLLAVALLATAATWTISLTARGPQLYVGGDALVDDIALRDGNRIMRTESWEKVAPERARVDSTAQGVTTEPFVTEMAAADGRRALLVTASPAGNPKRLWPLTPAEISSGHLAYEAKVLLTSTGPAGLVVGMVQDGGDAVDYDKGAVIFSNGRIRAWATDIDCGAYEAHRWYRVKVSLDLERNRQDVWIDGRLVAHDVPLTGGTELLREHPDWTETRAARDFEHFGIGGVYDATTLVQTHEPLPIVSHTGNEYVFRLDGAISGWRPTGIQLQPGDKVRITADPGQSIRYAGKSAPARTNPDGWLLQQSDPAGSRFLQESRFPVPAPAAWFGSLVARVGDGEGFFVGSSSEFSVHRGGELWLAYNDNYAKDNSGEILVSLIR